MNGCNSFLTGLLTFLPSFLNTATTVTLLKSESDHVTPSLKASNVFHLTPSQSSYKAHRDLTICTPPSSPTSLTSSLTHFPFSLHFRHCGFLRISKQVSGLLYLLLLECLSPKYFDVCSPISFYTQKHTFSEAFLIFSKVVHTSPNTRSLLYLPL